jgi:hypothetical protein
MSSGVSHALLRQVHLLEVTTAGRATLLLARARLVRRRLVRWIRRCCTVRGRKLPRQSIQGSKLRRELELELRGIDALGLGDHQAPALQLDLELEMAVRLAQPIALGDRLVGARLFCFTSPPV